jgi:hypothetical protein
LTLPFPRSRNSWNGPCGHCLLGNRPLFLTEEETCGTTGVRRSPMHECYRERLASNWSSELCSSAPCKATEQLSAEWRNIWLLRYFRNLVVRSLPLIIASACGRDLAIIAASSQQPALPQTGTSRTERMPTTVINNKWHSSPVLFCTPLFCHLRTRQKSQPTQAVF